MMSFITARGVSTTTVCCCCFFATAFSFFLAVVELELDMLFFTPPVDVEGTAVKLEFFDVFVLEEDGSVEVDDLEDLKKRKIFFILLEDR